MENSVEHPFISNFLSWEHNLYIMSLAINGTLIETVRVVDDKPERRRTVARDLVDMNVMPLPLDEKTADIDQFVEKVMAGAQAAVTDQELLPGNYAPCRGAELTKLCYDLRFPVVLVTRFKESIQDLRPYRPWIPVLLHPNEADPDRLALAFEVCYHEIHGEMGPQRRPWPAYVQVEHVAREDGRVSAVIPAWAPPDDGGEEGIQLFRPMFSTEVWEKVKEGDILMAKVNLGAERHEDLYLTEIRILDPQIQVSVA